MLKLGHIGYSNCVPVHGRFLERGPPPSVALVQGIPSRLNSRLERIEIDVALASSIEFARNGNRYRIVRGLSISSDRPVTTIQLLSLRPVEDMAPRARVAIPTASATSVTLLKIIMRQSYGIRPGTSGSSSSWRILLPRVRTPRSILAMSRVVNPGLTPRPMTWRCSGASGPACRSYSRCGKRAHSRQSRS
jgi:hypothetical protein